MESWSVVLTGTDEHTESRREVAGTSVAERARRMFERMGAERVLWLDEAPEGVSASSSEELASALAEQPTQTWIVGDARCVWDQGIVRALLAHDPELPTRVLVGDSEEARMSAWPAHALADALEERELTALTTWADETFAVEDPRAFVVVVDDAESASRAEDALWNACRKDIDGFISRHLNRHISLAISRRIVGWPVSPNQVTWLCILLGLASGLCAAEGSFAGIALGSVLLQANSVIDGVDGELARVRWQFSPIGEFLDSVGDNVANFSFFGGLTWAMYALGNDTIAMVGVACLVMWLSYVAFLYLQLSSTGSGDVLSVRQNIDKLDSGFVAKVVHVLRTIVLRRDGYVFITMLMCLLGLHAPLLVVMCIGAAIPFFGVFVHYGLALTRTTSEEGR